MTKEQVCRRLRRHFKAEWGTIGKAAKHYGVSGGHLSNICWGQRTATDQMLADIGIKRVKIPARYRYVRMG